MKKPTGHLRTPPKSTYQQLLDFARDAGWKHERTHRDGPHMDPEFTKDDQRATAYFWESKFLIAEVKVDVNRNYTFEDPLKFKNLDKLREYMEGV